MTSTIEMYLLDNDKPYVLKAQPSGNITSELPTTFDGFSVLTLDEHFTYKLPNVIHTSDNYTIKDLYRDIFVVSIIDKMEEGPAKSRALKIYNSNNDYIPLRNIGRSSFTICHTINLFNENGIGMPFKRIDHIPTSIIALDDKVTFRLFFKKYSRIYVPKDEIHFYDLKTDYGTYYFKKGITIKNTNKDDDSIEIEDFLKQLTFQIQLNINNVNENQKNITDFIVDILLTSIKNNNLIEYTLHVLDNTCNMGYSVKL